MDVSALDASNVWIRDRLDVSGIDVSGSISLADNVKLTFGIDGASVMGNTGGTVVSNISGGKSFKFTDGDDSIMQLTDVKTTIFGNLDVCGNMTLTEDNMKVRVSEDIGGGDALEPSFKDYIKYYVQTTGPQGPRGYPGLVHAESTVAKEKSNGLWMKGAKIGGDEPDVISDMALEVNGHVKITGDDPTVHIFPTSGASGKKSKISFGGTFGKHRDTDTREVAYIKAGFNDPGGIDAVWGKQYMAFNVGDASSTDTNQVNDNHECMRISAGGNVEIGMAIHIPESLDLPEINETAADNHDSGIIFKSRLNSGWSAGEKWDIKATASDVARIWHQPKRYGEVGSGDAGTHGLLNFSCNRRTDLSETPNMSITSTGNVGIGTTAPKFKTQITYAGAATINYGLNIHNSVAVGASNRMNLVLFTDNNSTQGAMGGYRMRHTNDYYGGLVFYIGSQPSGYNAATPSTPKNATDSLTEAMRISHLGNVGIGTTAPSEEVKLDVNGTVKVNSDIMGTSDNLDLYGNTNATNSTGFLELRSDKTVIGGNKIQFYTGSTPLAVGSNNMTLDGDGTLDVTGAVSFGRATRQMINLYGTDYGIGVQGSTQYLRSGGGFAWFHKGVHHNTERNAGTGGTTMMYLDDNNLVVAGTVTANNITGRSHKYPRIANVSTYGAKEASFSAGYVHNFYTKNKIVTIMPNNFGFEEMMHVYGECLGGRKLTITNTVDNQTLSDVSIIGKEDKWTTRHFELSKSFANYLNQCTVILQPGVSYFNEVISSPAFVHPSDDRLKTDEVFIENATETLTKLRPQIYVKHTKFVERNSVDTSVVDQIRSIRELRVKYPTTDQLPEPESTTLTPIWELLDISGNEIDDSGYIVSSSGEQLHSFHISNGGIESGLIAQEIYYGAPELRHLVMNHPTEPDDGVDPFIMPDNIQKDPDYSALGWQDEPSAVNYTGLIPYLIKSNQELHERIKVLEEKLGGTS